MLNSFWMPMKIIITMTALITTTMMIFNHRSTLSEVETLHRSLIETVVAQVNNPLSLAKLDQMVDKSEIEDQLASLFKLSEFLETSGLIITITSLHYHSIRKSILSDWYTIKWSMNVNYHSEDLKQTHKLFYSVKYKITNSPSLKFLESDFKPWDDLILPPADLHSFSLTSTGS